MADPDGFRHIEVGGDGQPAAAAEVTTNAGADGTVRAALYAPAGHIPPGRRASLVDAIMDLPEVRACTRMEATIPCGDGESLARLRERTENAVTRPAGSTTLLDANIPSGSQPGPDPDPDLCGQARQIPGAEEGNRCLHRNHRHRRLRAAPSGFRVDGPLYQKERARCAIDQETSGHPPGLPASRTSDIRAIVITVTF